MKRVSIVAIFMAFSISAFGNTTADDLYEKGMQLIREKNNKMFTKKDPPRIPGGLIVRHPLLNNARRMFKAATKNPDAEMVKQGQLWTCLKFAGLDFNSELIPSTTSRNLSFRSFGSGIMEEVSYGTNIVKMYALDKEDLAGINESGDLYEAIRVTEEGDLILESSVQGITWWEGFFASLIAAGKNISKLLKIVQRAMIVSVSQGDNSGFVFDYTVCPASRVRPPSKCNPSLVFDRNCLKK